MNTKLIFFILVSFALNSSLLAQKLDTEDVLIFTGDRSKDHILVSHYSFLYERFYGVDTIDMKNLLFRGYDTWLHSQDKFFVSTKNQMIYFLGLSGCGNEKYDYNDDGLRCKKQSLYAYDWALKQVVKIFDIEIESDRFVSSWCYSESDNSIYYIYDRQLKSTNLRNAHTKNIFDFNIFENNYIQGLVLWDKMSPLISIRLEGLGVGGVKSGYYHSVFVYDLIDKQSKIVNVGKAVLGESFSAYNDDFYLCNLVNETDDGEYEYKIISYSNIGRIEKEISFDNVIFYPLSDDSFVVLDQNILRKIDSDMSEINLFKFENSSAITILNADENTILLKNRIDNRMYVVDYEFEVERVLEESNTNELIQVTTLY